jgi:hypothetical protein
LSTRAGGLGINLQVSVYELLDHSSVPH